ncbi:Zn(2)-Cys(6) binuclear cluster domain-containing protein [Rhodocollybia butyracea]|uniref:Zn(2)-Cys(6) binuclear cluster domain-containing protein n=1 Tax=Rhodocollybia butyracea TaxID=206335 RepID=A0A9P5Q574_9AGAR|nr:Zn(2)-Cys(6) binuclear cluster domain-containing protein [Rhodocollybia butyracea]
MTTEKASASRSTNSPYSLQRGRACINCRSRCDGLRPTCTQCIKSARPGDACEYADGGRTRTQMLEDNISRLEARIRELEEPDDESAVRLHAPYSVSSHSSQTSSPSSLIVPLGAPSRYGSTLPSPTGTPRNTDSPSTESSPGHSSIYSVYQEEPSTDVIRQLLHTFLRHALDLGFFLNVSRFKNTALLPLPLGHYSRPSPGLLSTVYLLGVHLSGQPNSQESTYLARALTHTASMLSSSHPQRIIHSIQAEILLSVYFFRTGRILEAKYHMSAAVSLTIGTQLHKIRALPSENFTASPLRQISGGPLLDPPIDQIEEGERINAFWMAFTLNNCWGVAVGTLSSLVFESHGSTIDVPWPLDMAEYEQVMWNASRESGSSSSYFQSVHQGSMPMNHQSAMTVQNFLRQVPSASAKEFSTLAMFAKASILLDKSANLSEMYGSDMGADEASRYGANFASHDNLIDAFQNSLDLLQPVSPSSYEFGTVLTTRSLAYLATIQLHSVFIPVSPQSRRKALEAARACVMILRQVDLSGIAHVNAILGSCWTSVCQVLVDELKRMRRLGAIGHSQGLGLGIGGSGLHAVSSENWGRASLYDIEGGLEGVTEEDVVGMLEKVFATMAVFSMDSPLIGYQLSKVQEAYQTISR